ncbi:MAG: hypothetical protein ACJA10_001014 [Oleispira sp.]|jgi:hypothetical protein
MSLVNDVLRQLDADSAKPYQAMPLHTLMIDQPVKKNKLIGISFILIVGLLFLILTLQIFFKQSLVDIFYFNDSDRVEAPQKLLVALQPELTTKISKKDISDKNSISNSNDITTPDQLLITENTLGSDHDSEENFEAKIINDSLIVSKSIDSKVLKINTFKVQSAQNILRIKDDRMATVDDSSINDSVKKEVLIQGSEVKGSKIKGTDIKSTDVKNNQAKKLAYKENNYQKANITVVENIGFKHYQLSLRAYKNKQTSVALSWVDLALAAEKKDEYLRLKVRILMQKGERAELHRFVLAQSDNTSLDWFQLIAPSLQMYAYYDLSNKYYSELIKQQPNDVRWQLAMALNYSKLEQNEKTYSIYKALLNSSLLTYKQQRWVAKRLGRIEQGKVAINER